MLAWGRATQLTQLEISFLCQKLLGSVIERNFWLSCPWLLLHFQHLHHQNVQLILFSSVMPSVLRGKLPLGLCTTHAGCPSRVVTVVTLLYFVLRCRRQTSKNKQFTHLGMTSEHLSTQVQAGSFGQSYACRWMHWWALSSRGWLRFPPSCLQALNPAQFCRKLTCDGET